MHLSGLRIAGGTYVHTFAGAASQEMSVLLRVAGRSTSRTIEVAIVLCSD